MKIERKHFLEHCFEMKIVWTTNNMSWILIFWMPIKLCTLYNTQATNNTSMYVCITYSEKHYCFHVEFEELWFWEGFWSSYVTHLKDPFVMMFIIPEILGWFFMSVGHRSEGYLSWNKNNLKKSRKTIGNSSYLDRHIREFELSSEESN